MTDIVLCIKSFVSATYCRSSSGDSVGLLNRTTCPTVVVSDWCITELAHSWWVSIQIAIIQYNIQLMRKRNHAFLLLAIALTRKWDIS